MNAERIDVTLTINDAEAAFIASLLARVEAPVVSEKREAIVGLIRRIETSIKEAKEKQK